MPTCDFIVPVHNNAAVIQRTLAALINQQIPPGWLPRLIIINNGSTDNSLSLIQRVSTPYPWRQSIILNQPQAGAAAARNHGFNHADADIIFFLGADMILRPTAVSQHLYFHANHPATNHAALGMVKWDPRIMPTPFMEWMMHGGSQNNFDALLGSRTAPPAHFFYGSHLSIKRAFLNNHPFFARFHSYGWEDLELGRRLKSRGLKLFVLHGAIGLHHHYYSAANILKRQHQAGLSLPIYQELHPHITLISTGTSYQQLKRALFHISGLGFLAAQALSITAHKWSTPRLFSTICAHKLRQGIKKAI